MNDRDDDLEQLIGDRDPGMVKGGPPSRRVANGHTIVCSEEDYAAAEVVKCAACGDVVKSRRLPLTRRLCPGWGPTSPPDPADAGKVAAALGEDARRWEAAGWVTRDLRVAAFIPDADAGGLHPSSPTTVTMRAAQTGDALVAFQDGAARDVLTFRADGTIKVGEGVTADEAAAAVVEALRPRFAEMIRQERAALDQRALISLAAELKRRAEIRQGDPSGEGAARLRAAARIVEGVATGAPAEATVCPLRACSEPHVHGPTGERHNAFDEARARPTAPATEERALVIRLLLDLDHEARHLAEDASEETPTCDACGEPQRDGDGNPITRRVTVDPEGFDRLCAALDAIDPNEGHDASTYDRLRERLALPTEEGRAYLDGRKAADEALDKIRAELGALFPGKGPYPMLEAARAEIERLTAGRRTRPAAAPAAPTSGAPLSAFERLEAAIGELRAWQANDDNAAPIDDICEVVDAFDAFTTAREPAPVTQRPPFASDVPRWRDVTKAW